MISHPILPFSYNLRILTGIVLSVTLGSKTTKKLSSLTSLFGIISTRHVPGSGIDRLRSTVAATFPSQSQFVFALHHWRYVLALGFYPLGSAQYHLGR